MHWTHPADWAYVPVDDPRRCDMPLAQVAEIGTGLKVFWRGDAEYEITRRKMWNCRVPARYPDVIVQPQTEDEVVAAVRLARRRGLKIAIRSGGHSWAANF